MLSSSQAEMMTGLVFDRLCAKICKRKCRLELREDKRMQKNANTSETADLLASNLCSLSLLGAASGAVHLWSIQAMIQALNLAGTMKCKLQKSIP